MQLIVKKPGEEPVRVETQQKYRLDAVKEVLGGDIAVEFVHLTDTLSLAVDEDGLFKQLPVNFLIPMTNPYFPIQKMVGTVVFVNVKPPTNKSLADLSAEDLLSGNFDPADYEIYDYEMADMTLREHTLIEYMLNQSFQAYLEANFVDYGDGSAVIVPFKSKE